MGTWGNKLFDDDTACDVRDEYLDLLAEGHAGPTAVDVLQDRWRDTVADPDEGPVFWLALAATQHQLGRLEPRVKKEALAVLDEGLGLDRWRETGAHSVRGRVNSLEKMRQQILSPQPREKPIAPRFEDSCPWEVGEVVSFQLKSDRLALLCVIGHETHAGGRSPVCELLDWSRKTPPAAVTLENLGALHGKLPPEVLLRALATTYPEHEANLNGTQQQMLADMGLISQPDLRDGFDPRHFCAVTKTIVQLQDGNRRVTQQVHDFARQRKPELLAPVTQFSLRREKKKSELPAKRVKRLKLRRTPSQPLGEWLVIRWYELDDALRGVFDLK